MKSVFFFILCACLGFSEIVSIGSLKEADLRGLSHLSLVLFDVDEVLLTPKDAVLKASSGKVFKPKTEITDDHLSIMLDGTQYVLVDPSAPQMIQALQTKKIPTLAFTSCRTGPFGVIESMENWRYEQLKQQGIDFSSSQFEDVSFPHLASQNPPKLDRGILFCGDFYRSDGSTKGELLKIFLGSMNRTFDKIVFFDDEMKHLIAVEKELMKQKIPFKGYHLKIENLPFNEAIADLQFKTVVEKKKWLSDQEAAQLKTVVFDFGGVMTGNPDRNAVIQFLQETFLLSDAEFETVNQLKRQAIKAGITDEEFWLSYALDQGINLPENWAETLKGRMKKAVGANPASFQLVQELKTTQVPVALFSNIDSRLSKLIREFGFYEPFDLCLLSCEIGLEKPDPKAYEYLIEQIGAPAPQIIFIDDRPENVEAARTLGIDAIQFESIEQIRRELEQRQILHQSTNL